MSSDHRRLSTHWCDAMSSSSSSWLCHQQSQQHAPPPPTPKALGCKSLPCLTWFARKHCKASLCISPILGPRNANAQIPKSILSPNEDTRSCHLPSPGAAPGTPCCMWEETMPLPKFRGHTAAAAVCSEGKRLAWGQQDWLEVWFHQWNLFLGASISH